MSLIRDSVQAFQFLRRQQGWRSAVGQAAQFFRAPFFEFHRGYVLRKSLQDSIHVPPPDKSVSIRQADLDDLALFETIVPPLRVKRLAKKIQAGELCCVAMDEARVVAYVFAGFANTPSTAEARLELDPEEVYIWAGFALPQYRRQGVVRAVNLSLCRLLRQKGYESAILLVDQSNKASLGHCNKMGYCLTDRIMHLRVFRWALTRVSPIQEPVGDDPIDQDSHVQLPGGGI